MYRFKETDTSNSIELQPAIIAIVAMLDVSSNFHVNFSVIDFRRVYITRCYNNEGGI